MAAATENEDFGESPLDLPFTYLLHDTVVAVTVSMTLESARRKMDWRALAGILGFNFKEIELMQQDMRHSCKGRLLLDVWENAGGRTSLRKLIYALKEAKMEECLRIIKNDYTLEESDFQKAVEEYEDIKKRKVFRKEFPRISMEAFSEVMYPSVRCDIMGCVQPQAPASTEVENENKLQSSVPDNCPADNVLDKRSVYISFCPETGFSSFKFNQQLRRFTQFIQDQGFTLHFEPNCDAEIRKYGDKITWREACIKRSKTIIVICTQEYFKEDNKILQSVATGKRVRSKIEMDSRYLRQVALNRVGSQRVIPVTLDVRMPSQDNFPMWLSPLVRYSWPSSQADLVLCLEELPRYKLLKPDPTRRIIIKPILIKPPIWSH